MAQPETPAIAFAGTMALADVPAGSSAAAITPQALDLTPSASPPAVAVTQSDSERSVTEGPARSPSLAPLAATASEAADAGEECRPIPSERPDGDACVASAPALESAHAARSVQCTLASKATCSNSTAAATAASPTVGAERVAPESSPAPEPEAAPGASAVPVAAARGRVTRSKRKRRQPLLDAAFVHSQEIPPVVPRAADAGGVPLRALNACEALAGGVAPAEQMDGHISSNPGAACPLPDARETTEDQPVYATDTVAGVGHDGTTAEGATAKDTASPLPAINTDAETMDAEMLCTPPRAAIPDAWEPDAGPGIVSASVLADSQRSWQQRAHSVRGTASPRLNAGNHCASGSEASMPVGSMRKSLPASFPHRVPASGPDVAPELPASLPLPTSAAVRATEHGYRPGHSQADPQLQTSGLFTEGATTSQAINALQDSGLLTEESSELLVRCSHLHNLAVAALWCVRSCPGTDSPGMQAHVDALMERSPLTPHAAARLSAAASALRRDQAILRNGMALQERAIAAKSATTLASSEQPESEPVSRLCAAEVHVSACCGARSQGLESHSVEASQWAPGQLGYPGQQPLHAPARQAVSGGSSPTNGILPAADAALPVGSDSATASALATASAAAHVGPVLPGACEPEAPADGSPSGAHTKGPLKVLPQAPAAAVEAIRQAALADVLSSGAQAHGAPPTGAQAPAAAAHELRQKAPTRTSSRKRGNPRAGWQRRKRRTPTPPPTAAAPLPLVLAPRAEPCEATASAGPQGSLHMPADPAASTLAPSNVSAGAPTPRDAVQAVAAALALHQSTEQPSAVAGVAAELDSSRLVSVQPGESQPLTLPPSMALACSQVSLTPSRQCSHSAHACIPDTPSGSDDEDAGSDAAGWPSAHLPGSAQDTRTARSGSATAIAAAVQPSPARAGPIARPPDAAVWPGRASAPEVMRAACDLVPAMGAEQAAQLAQVHGKENRETDAVVLRMAPEPMAGHEPKQRSLPAGAIGVAACAAVRPGLCLGGVPQQVPEAGPFGGAVQQKKSRLSRKPARPASASGR